MSRPWIAAIVSAVIILIVGHTMIYEYWVAPFIQGWDGMGHAVIGQYYSEHIFPSLWGWTSHWYNGMPWPQFYPPLLYVALALIAHIAVGVPYIFIFKIFIISLQLLVPGVMIYFVARRTKHPGAIWMTAIVGCIFVLARFPNMESYGMNITSTLDTGSVSQLLAFFFSILWLDNFLRIEHSRSARIYGPLLLAGVFLANVHECMSVAIAFFTVYIASLAQHRLRGKKALMRITKIYFIHGAAALLLTACWTVPLYETYMYFVTISPSHPPSLTFFLAQAWIIPLGLALGYWGGFRARDRDLTLIPLIGISTFIAIYALDPINTIGMPFHVNRWFGGIIFLMPIIAGLLWDRYAHCISRRSYRVGAFVASIAIIGLLAGTYNPFQQMGQDGFYASYAQDHITDIEPYIERNRDRIGTLMVESTSGYTNQPMSKLDSSLGATGIGASTIIFRESSIDSIFLTPIRNAISSDHEGWGFRSYLVFDPQIRAQDLSMQLDRAWNTGLQSFLLRSSALKTLFASNSRVELLATFGPWQLYSFKEKAPRASILSHTPTMFYGDLNFKERTIDSYDWARIQEELLFQNLHDVTFAYAHDQNLDTTTDFEQASSIFISGYHYRDIDVAERHILSYARSYHVALIESNDPLYLRIKYAVETSAVSTYNISFIPRLEATDADQNPLRAQLSSVFHDIEVAQSQSVTTSTSSTLALQHIDIQDDAIHVALSGTSSTPRPVLIQSTYFPAWKRTDAMSPIYLASPAFSLVYATSSFSLKFTTPWYVYLGWMISGVTLVGFVIAANWSKRRGS